jgi:hypothetical protein
LPAQYGSTVVLAGNTTALSFNDSFYSLYSMGLKYFPPDEDWKQYAQQNDYGWYWGVLPAILAGFSVRCLAGIAVCYVLPSYSDQPLFFLIYFT